MTVCAWCGEPGDFRPDPVFHEPTCEECFGRVEEAVLAVEELFEEGAERYRRWPMFWRVLRKIVEKPEEYFHVPGDCGGKEG